MARQGVGKRKEGRERGEGPGASGCHHPPIGLSVGSGDLGPDPLAVYGTALGGWLEATGRDEPCACINQML